MTRGPHKMKFEIGTICENVVNGISESNRRCLRRMWFWVEDDLDSSRVVRVHEDEVNFGVFLDISLDVFCRLG